MRGLWLQDEQLTYREDLADPTPPPGEALIRVELAGICRTDIELLRGYYPYRGIPGHEFVGTVIDAPGSRHLEGRRVVGEINAVCGSCPECLSGRPNHCRKRTVLGIVNRDGAFAEFLSLPAQNLHLVPEGVTARQAVFTEPLAAALRIGEQEQIGPGDRVLLIGAGKLGQLVARVLAPMTGRLTVLARYPRQRKLLAPLGIEVLKDLPSDFNQFDLIVEATGSPEGLDLAVDRIRPGGTIVLKSTYAGPASLDFSGLVVNEIRLVGSRCGPFAPAQAMMQEGHFDPEPLIEAEFPLRSGLDAFTRAEQPSAMKVLLLNRTE